MRPWLVLRWGSDAVPLGDEARAYAETLLANAAFREWEAAAVAEPWTLPRSDAA
jgi:hypothetical protein